MNNSKCEVTTPKTIGLFFEVRNIAKSSLFRLQNPSSFLNVQVQFKKDKYDESENGEQPHWEDPATCNSESSGCQIPEVRLNQWTSICTTKTCEVNCQPTFNETVQVDPDFTDFVKIQLFEENMLSHRFIGDSILTLSELMLKTPYTKCLDINDSRDTKQGELFVWGEEQDKYCRDKVKMRIYARSLDRAKYFLGRNAPFVVISRFIDTHWVPIWRSQCVVGQLNPDWEDIEIPLQRLKGMHKNSRIKVECFHLHDKREVEYIGGFETTYAKLLDPKMSSKWNPLLKPLDSCEYGQLLIQKMEIDRHDTFFEYIVGGCDINLIVAIDFTLGDGHTKSIETEKMREQSKQCIRMVSSIAKTYSIRKDYTVIGFGGHAKGDTKPNDYFPVTFYTEQFGCSSVIAEYERRMKTTLPSHKSVAATVISNTADMIRVQSKPTQSRQNYHILFIITDGKIDQVNSTIDEIVKASNLPLSIVIIGVGNGDFRLMKTLDGDGAILFGGDGEISDRDIVQFVPYEDFCDNQELLRQQVLEEIPEQLVSYMRQNNIFPNRPLKNRNIDVNINNDESFCV